MTNAHKLTAALALVLALLSGYVVYGWVKEHETSLVLATQQKADRDTQAALAKQQADNQAAFATALKPFADLKAQGQTVPQIIRLAPQVVTVPTPISQQVTAAQATAANAAVLPDAPQMHPGDLIIPLADVKPLYDAQVQCKIDGITLDACNKTVAIDKSVMASKDEEISQQAQALKGGTKWQRIKSALKWSGVGVAIGAAAVEYAIHK